MFRNLVSRSMACRSSWPCSCAKSEAVCVWPVTNACSADMIVVPFLETGVILVVDGQCWNCCLEKSPHLLSCSFNVRGHSIHCRYPFVVEVLFHNPVHCLLGSGCDLFLLCVCQSGHNSFPFQFLAKPLNVVFGMFCCTASTLVRGQTCSGANSRTECAESHPAFRSDRSTRICDPQPE